MEFKEKAKFRAIAYNKQNEAKCFYSIAYKEQNKELAHFLEFIEKNLKAGFRVYVYPNDGLRTENWLFAFVNGTRLDRKIEFEQSRFKLGVFFENADENFYQYSTPLESESDEFWSVVNAAKIFRGKFNCAIIYETGSGNKIATIDANGSGKGGFFKNKL